MAIILKQSASVETSLRLLVKFQRLVAFMILKIIQLVYEQLLPQGMGPGVTEFSSLSK